MLALLIKYSWELCYMLLSSCDSILGIKVSKVLMHSRGMEVTPSQISWKWGLRHFHSLCNLHILIKLMQQLLKTHLDSTAGRPSGELFSPVPSSAPPVQSTFQSSYLGFHPRGRCLSKSCPDLEFSLLTSMLCSRKKNWLSLNCMPRIGKECGFLKLFLMIKEAILRELAHTKQLRH